MDKKEVNNKGSKNRYSLRQADGSLKMIYTIILVFLLHELVLAFSIADLSYSIFNAADFVRWDSSLYIHISQNGYELMPCWQVFSAYPVTSTDWCGNAGWMPLYAYGIAVLKYLGIHEYHGAFLISKICLLTVYTCIVYFIKGQNKIQKTLSLILVAIFPASVYYDAAFPISLMMALILSSYCLWENKHYKTAYALAFLIPLSYSTGFLILAPWFVMTIHFRRIKSDLLKPAIKVFISILLGYFTFFIIQRLSLGVWNGFFLIQQKYGHGFHNFIHPIWLSIKSLWVSGINHNWQNIQSLTVLALLLFFSIQKHGNKPLSELFIRFTFIVLAAFPIIIGSSDLSQFRAESLLLPISVLIGQKRGLAIVLIPLFLYLFINCSIEFFKGSII